MRPPTCRLALLFVALLAGTIQAFAAPEAAYADPSTPGALRVERPDGRIVEMPLRHTKVAIEVTGFVSRASIEQEFQNPFNESVEAVYTFPLGDRAAVDDFELVVGDRTIRGVIKRREEARATYEQARAAGLQAALLEQERPNIFTQSVANLDPGKSIKVRLRTVETLRYERGIYRLTFPLVVGPRYIPGSAVADAARISPPVLAPGTRSGHDVSISVTIDAGVPLTNLQSPSHRCLFQRTSGRIAAARLADDDSIPNKDFLLRWSVASERPALGFLAHRDGPDGYFALLVQPKAEVGAAEAMPKEITFVLDTSGSMSGIPLEASKRLAAKALRALGPRDTFNLIRFAGDNEVYAKTALANDRGEIEAALTWLNRQQGGGGTEMMAALTTAFARPRDPNRLRVVIFLTDGYVGNEAEILSAIGKVIGDARIYTIGIGSSVNHHLLDRMADLGRGSYVFVRPDESADDALEAFRSWVTRPYLTDLTIDWGALNVLDVSPEKLPDIGSGQTLTVVGRYVNGASGNVVVRGKLGGRYFEQSIAVTLPEREAKGEALGSLWARWRIEALMRNVDMPLPDSIRTEVTDLALAHRLMSPYTSFVAIDESRVVNPSGTSRTVHQALPMPEGVSYEGVFGAARSDDRQFKTVVGGVGAAQPTSLVASADVETGRAKSGFQQDFVQDLPVAGRFYHETLELAPGVQAPDGDGNPNVNGARERDFKTQVGGIASPLDKLEAKDGQLLDTAFLLLADIAEDGKLSVAEGKPALATLMAAQLPTGALADDVATHAVATWALAEAARVNPGDATIAAVRKNAVDYLVRLAQPSGWPARAGGAVDAEATRWARLVLGRLAPSAVKSIAAPAGQPSQRFAQLSAAFAVAKNGGTLPAVAGPSPFARLVNAIGRGNLKVVRM